MSTINDRKPDYKSAWIFPILGFVTASAYAIFIFPNSFAPAGVGGIATMVQKALKFNAGYLNLIINIPILIAAWFLVDREFVVKSGLFTVFFSGFLMLLDLFDFSQFVYRTENGTSTILAPVAAAAVNGTFYGFALRIRTEGRILDDPVLVPRHPAGQLVFRFRAGPQDAGQAEDRIKRPVTVHILPLGGQCALRSGSSAQHVKRTKPRTDFQGETFPEKRIVLG